MLVYQSESEILKSISNTCQKFWLYIRIDKKHMDINKEKKKLKNQAHFSLNLKQRPFIFQPTKRH